MDGPEYLYDSLMGELREWSGQGFPQAWGLQGFSDEPTRFVVARLIESQTARRAVLLVNGFPSSARGCEFVQLRATVEPVSVPEWSAASVSWEVVADDGADVVGRLSTQIVEESDRRRCRDIAEWFLARLSTACQDTNRKVFPTQPTRSAT